MNKEEAYELYRKLENLEDDRIGLIKDIDIISIFDIDGRCEMGSIVNVIDRETDDQMDVLIYDRDSYDEMAYGIKISDNK